MIDLTGKVIVITGGLGLLGMSFGKSVRDAGGITILADISKPKEKLDDSLHYYELDITSKSSVNSLINRVADDFGKIDALVNNAYPRNKNYGRKLPEVEYSDFCENLSLNLGGTFLVMQQFAEYFQENKQGNIINISSIYGIIAPRFDVYEENMTMPVEYAAIKSALNHLTKYFSKYYRPTNIRFNTLSPGGIEDSQPQSFQKKYRNYCSSKGMLDKQDVCGTLLYLLSDLSCFVNGQNIAVDDGFTL